MQLFTATAALLTAAVGGVAADRYARKAFGPEYMEDAFRSAKRAVHEATAAKPKSKK